MLPEVSHEIDAHDVIALIRQSAYRIVGPVIGSVVDEDELGIVTKATSSSRVRRTTLPNHVLGVVARYDDAHEFVRGIHGKPTDKGEIAAFGIGNVKCAEHAGGSAVERAIITRLQISTGNIGLRPFAMRESIALLNIEQGIDDGIVTQRLHAHGKDRRRRRRSWKVQPAARLDERREHMSFKPSFERGLVKSSIEQQLFNG